MIVLLVLFLCFVVFVFISYVRLAFLPVQPVNTNQELKERGSIVDKNGKRLAVQTNFYNVGVTPHLIKNKQKFANDVSSVLSLPSGEILNLIDKNEDASFIYLKKKITQTAYTELKKITDANNYHFVTFDKIPGRIYPENNLASLVIGYMGDEGEGLAGIEYSMQDYLVKETRNDIFLTLDINLQYKLENIARKTLDSTQAESMMLLAMEAKTGEILSYISLPSVNLNEYTSSDIQERVDRPAMTAYEPGSVFKIFTVSAAYDKGLIAENSTFVCDGVYVKKIKGGDTVRIKCLEHHGKVTARDALKYSCNDALGQISDKLSDNDFIAKIKEFGFGKKTGIELPGETAGLVKDTNASSWSARSKPTIAIGQEISVSALQMIQAASAIANKGILVRPTIIKKIVDKDGKLIYQHEIKDSRKIMSEKTAAYVLSCMETTARSGTGSRANLHDISIGVKTGTAQMASKKGGYSDTDFLSNCIAIFPVEDPEIILYIVVEKAKGETYAGRIVAPVIAEAADEIIDYLGMSRGDAESLEHSGKINITSAKPLHLGKTLPDFTGMDKRDVVNILNENKIKVKINGSGWVKTQKPEPGTPITENMIIELNLE